MIMTLLGQVKQYRRDSILTPVFTALEVLMEVLIPFITASLIDQGIEAGNMTKVLQYGGLMLAIAFCSLACLACGTCTFICPTCQCYDIRDYNTGNGIQRFRCWDSCMYSDFTLMAHGNIRNSQKERFRQRFMHKLVYFPENNDGMFSCVGCGRCVSKCPSSLNIVKVIKSLGVSEDV